MQMPTRTARAQPGLGLGASPRARSRECAGCPKHFVKSALPVPAPRVIRARLMFVFIITLHVIVSVFIIFVILLQPGKGDAMAAFAGGGGSSNTVFGGRGSVTFL